MNNYLDHLDNMYNKKSFERKVDYIRYNFSEIFKQKKFGKNVSILEIGPGKGEMIHYLNIKGIKDIDVIDNDKNVLKYIKKRFKIKNSYLSNSPISIKSRLGKYDLIVMIQVLEHLATVQHKKLLQILYKHLNNSGYIAIVVPNAGNPLGIVERYGDLQHTTSFTEQSLKDLVNFSGLKNCKVYIRGYEMPPFSLLNIIRIFLQKILHWILLLILIINGGIFFRTLAPNIMLLIKKSDN